MKKFSLVVILFAVLGCFIFNFSSVSANQVSEEKSGIIGNVIRHSSAETGIIMISDHEVLGDFMPAVGVEVILEGPETRNTITDHNGEFAFFDLEPGEYKLEVTSSLYLSASVPNIIVEAGEIFDIKSQLPEGIPLGSTFYLFLGVERENQAFYANTSSFVMYNALSQFNALSRETALMNGANFSKIAFKDYLENLGRKITSFDQFVLYYSGVTFINPLDGKVYLDCSDAKYIGEYPVYETLISEDEITAWLNENLPSKPAIFIILDAPHSEVIGEFLANELESSVCVIAGAKNEEWYEIIDFSTGAFTLSMLSGFVSINESSGLPYADIDEDGKVTVSEVVRFTSLFLELLLNDTDLKPEVSVYVNDMEFIDNTIFVLNR